MRIGAQNQSGDPRRRPRAHTLKTAATVTLVWACGMSTAHAYSGSIDFETLPDPQPVEKYQLSVQYGSVGVIFESNSDGGLLPRRVKPPSDSTVYPQPKSGEFLVIGPDFGQEFHDSDLRIRFTAAQSFVQLYAGTTADCSAATGRIIAYGKDTGNGPPIVEFSPNVPLPVGTVSVPISVSAPDPRIWEIRFRESQGDLPCIEAIDDLSFTGDSPPPPPGPPAIVLTNPHAGTTDFGLGAPNVIGTVTGTDLYQVQLDLTTSNTSTGQPSITTFTVPMNGTSGTQLSFSKMLGTGQPLPYGTYQILATVTDFFGQSGQTSVTFTNFPSGVGNDPTLGPFIYAAPRDNCQMLFYQNGVVAYSATSMPTTIPVPTVIANKWLTAVSPVLGASQTLGCPTAAAQPATADVVTQEFDRGRIYETVSTANAVYIPDVIRGALFALGHRSGIAAEIAQVGLPVADPDWDLDVDNPTWLFQRYSHNDLGVAYQNTLEIRGRTPYLLVERIGGDVDELALAQSHSSDPASPPDGPAIIDFSTPTYLQVFPCSVLDLGVWPTTCNMSAVADPPYELPIFDAGVFCGAVPGCTQDCPHFGFGSVVLSDDPTFSWKTVSTGLPSDAIYRGVIRPLDEKGPSAGSHLANEDYFGVHEHCNPNGEGATDSTVDQLLVSISDCFSLIFSDDCPSDVSTLTDGTYCRSDWNLHTRPLPNMSNWQFLSTGNQLTFDDFEIEFEAYWAQSYFKGYIPVPGDLVSVHGRQIADCAHSDPYKTEIHPVDALVVSRSIVSQPYSNEPPIRTTDAYLWGNAFLGRTGSPPVSVVVYPPPRTSARAALQLLQHEAGGYYHPGTINAATTLSITGGVITMSRTVPVNVTETDEGEWLYPDSVGNEFVDNWQLSWKD